MSENENEFAVGQPTADPVPAAPVVEAPVVAESAPVAAEPVASTGASAADILTQLDEGLDALLHSPFALVAFVRSKIAEAKAAL